LFLDESEDRGWSEGCYIDEEGWFPLDIEEIFWAELIYEELSIS
jgi:hypothetical protein